jgi:hypothetical protein
LRDLISNIRTRFAPIVDRLGIGLSGLCLLHCTAVPLLLVVLPFFPILDQTHGSLHIVFLLLLVPVTSLAMYTGYLRHGRTEVVLLMALGLLLVGVAVLLAPHEGLFGETSLTVAGSGFLILGHWRNLRFRQCDISSPDPT